MKTVILKKSAAQWRIAPNLSDYGKTREAWNWGEVWRELAGEPAPRLVNLAALAVGSRANARRVALRWLGKSGETRDFTYAQLDGLSDRFAAGLSGLGVRKGDRVFTLLERVPELYVTALGTLKNGSVFCPLFSALGPEAIQTRLSLGAAKVLITTEPLYAKKVAAIRSTVPSLEACFRVGAGFESLMKSGDVPPPLSATGMDDMALLHFTSGTTGKPKGAVHVHGAAAMHYATGKLALDLHPDDVFWCTADPGWVTGTSYGIFSPLLNGVTSIVDEAEFDAERWYRILQDQKVTVWYTAPTAIRMLMKAGVELARKFDLSRLRFIGSVGEPLNPEAVVWGRDVLGFPIHDSWWQTETGGIMIANFAAQDIKPGSMGLPIPGIEAAIVERGGPSGIKVLTEPDRVGELALKRGWPSMFRGYLGEEERYRKCFAGDYYLTGDLARRDEDGYYWFVGRADDVIKSAGPGVGSVTPS